MVNKDGIADGMRVVRLTDRTKRWDQVKLFC